MSHVLALQISISPYPVIAFFLFKWSRYFIIESGKFYWPLFRDNVAVNWKCGEYSSIQTSNALDTNGTILTIEKCFGWKCNVCLQFYCKYVHIIQNRMR